MDAQTEKTLQCLLESLLERQRAEQAEWEALPEMEKQRIRAEERRREAAGRREALIAGYKTKGIPPAFYDATWENWKGDTDEKRKAFQTVRDKAWKTNLFLCGKSGTGKTHLAMCLTKDGAQYRRLPDIFREVRMNLSAEQDIIDRYGTARFLIIDEVGRQKFTAFEKDLFFEIIDKRWNNRLPTTLVTNLTENEFIAEYGMAIIDRLRPIIVRFNWESSRKSLEFQEDYGGDGEAL